MSRGQLSRADDTDQEWVGSDQTAAAGAVAASDHLATWTDKITIGEALETTARTAGDRPVERHDAAAIAAAEANATGVNAVLPGGVAAADYMAADANAVVPDEQLKTKLGDVLGHVVSMISADKVVTREEDAAARVAAAEVQTNPNVETRPGGVAATVAAAARVNEQI